ncbi:cysteine hydrolase family protein [Chloroflexota bacterium]
MANAVLVVDMLKGFLEEGYPLYIGEKCRSIIPDIRHLIEKEIGHGSKIYFICDNHAPDDLEFKIFPPHCIEGTVEAQIIPELAGYFSEIILKRRYSGFFGTTLENSLTQLNPDKLIICGVLTNICVMHTVADAKNRDYVVEVPANCVASPDKEAHRFALKHIREVLGAIITNTGA